MYRFKEWINQDLHFWFDKDLILNSHWKMLPPASKAIFPVIAAHRNRRGIAFPGETNIAILAGRTEKSVRHGIEALHAMPDLNIESYITARGHRSKRFIFEMTRYERGRAFPFHKEVFEGGNWSLLKPTSQAVYPVMRCYGFFDPELYRREYPDLFVLAFQFRDQFIERKYDFCDADPRLIAEMAGISFRSYRAAFENLQEHGLIESMGDSPFKVFLHPAHRYNHEYLNSEIRRKYEKLVLPVERKSPVMDKIKLCDEENSTG